MAFNVSVKELQSYHTIDRDLFVRLVNELGYDNNLAMKVMAYWLWTEEVGFPSVIVSAQNIPGVLLNAAFHEAVSVLNCLENDENPAVETPVTFILMHEQVGLQAVYDNRSKALEGISKIVREVCLKAFMVEEEQAAEEIDQGREVNPSYASLAGSESGAVVMEPSERARVRPSFNFRALQEAIDSCAEFNLQVVNEHNQVGESSQAVSGNESLDDRSMFFTFSKGFPVSEQELLTYFQRNFGDVIEWIRMGNSREPGAQPMFARVLFRSPATVENILSGLERVKFVVNHKHVMCRRYVTKG